MNKEITLVDGSSEASNTPDGGANDATEKTNEEPTRTRNWATIVYAESAPADWKEILENLHVPALVSPPHNKDKGPEGNLLKEHYHVLLMFESVKSRKQIHDLVKSFGGVGAEYVNSLPAYARYLIHMDSPEKAQYDAKDIVELSGASFEAVAKLSINDMDDIREMLKYIRDNQIVSFAGFSDICAQNNETWLELLTKKRLSFFFRDYIKSFAWELKDEQMSKRK